MRKTILSILLSLPLCSTFAFAATEQSTQNLIQVLDKIGYFDQIVNDESIQKSTRTIMTYYAIPDTENNKQQVFAVLKKNYSSPEFKSMNQQLLANIYQENSTEEEIKQWIKFHSSDIGKSILKNEPFMNNYKIIIENIFPHDYIPSKSAQEKMEKLMKRFTQQGD